MGGHLSGPMQTADTTQSSVARAAFYLQVSSSIGQGRPSIVDTVRGVGRGQCPGQAELSALSP